MTQRRVGSGLWVDWSSQEEGHYPEHDGRAKAAVKMMNANREASRLEERALDLERQASRMLWKASETCRKAREYYHANVK